MWALAPAVSIGLVDSGGVNQSLFTRKRRRNNQSLMDGDEMTFFQSIQYYTRRRTKWQKNKPQADAKPEVAGVTLQQLFDHPNLVGIDEGWKKRATNAFGEDADPVAEIAGSSVSALVVALEVIRPLAVAIQNTAKGLLPQVLPGRVEVEIRGTAEASAEASAEVSRADDLLDISMVSGGQSASGLAEIGAAFDPEAIVLSGQAAMASVMLRLGLVDIFGEGFWRNQRLPVRSPLRVKVDAMLTAMETGQVFSEGARGRLYVWVSGLFGPEFDQMMATVADLNSMQMAMLLAGRQAGVDVTDQAGPIGQLLTTLPLLGEKLTEAAITSTAPQDTVRAIAAVKSVTGLLLDPELHQWMGGSAAVAKTPTEAAIELIKRLADPMTAPNQMRLALAYEFLMDAVAGFLKVPTGHNLGVVGRRATTLKVLFGQVASGVSEGQPASAEPFPVASAVVEPQRVAATSKARAASGFSFTLSLKLGRG
jgi:hypothetical protein